MTKSRFFIIAALLCTVLLSGCYTYYGPGYRAMSPYRYNRYYNHGFYHYPYRYGFYGRRGFGYGYGRRYGYWPY